MLTHLRIATSHLRVRATRKILRHRVCAHNPTLWCDPTAIWDYGFHDLDAIEIGANVAVRAYSEILVYKRSPHSRHEGRLILGDRATISTGANIRAAGGTIRIGHGSGVAQNCVLVAANHRILQGIPMMNTSWDEDTVGIDIGDNVWVGAGCIVLPGVHIGNNSVIAAGSVVHRDVPPDQIWGGWPARFIKRVPAAAEDTAHETTAASAA